MYLPNRTDNAIFGDFASLLICCWWLLILSQLPLGFRLLLPFVYVCAPIWMYITAYGADMHSILGWLDLQFRVGLLFVRFLLLLLLCISYIPSHLGELWYNLSKFVFWWFFLMLWLLSLVGPLRILPLLLLCVGVVHILQSYSALLFPLFSYSISLCQNILFHLSCIWGCAS